MSSKQEAKVVYISPQIAERMLKQDSEIYREGRVLRTLSGDFEIREII